MEVEELNASQFVNCPPLMPWRQFANWIHMESEQETVRGWIDKGYRVEFRFHHSVVEQFAQGSHSSSGEILNSCNYAELATHLQGLFEYGLDTFKLLHRVSYTDPLWTILHRETSFLAPVDRFVYRRYYKTARGFSGKNIELMLGNAITLFARNRMDFASCWAALKLLPVFHLVEEYYREKGRSQTWLKKHLAKKLEERYVRYGLGG